MSSQKLCQQEYLAIAQRMFNERPKGDPAKKVKNPFAGKVVRAEVFGRLDCWNEEKGFGFIQTPHEDTTRVFCHNSGFLKDCQVDDFVKFDVWKNKDSQKLEAINITPSQITSIEVAKDQFGTIEQWWGIHGLIRGDDGRACRCGEADFDGSSYRRFDRVRFDSVWQGPGQFKAVNIRPEWSQEEWDEWRARRWYAEDKAAAVEDKASALDVDGCGSTDAGTEAPSEPVNPEVRKLLKKLREIDALTGRQDLDALQQAKVAMKDKFQRQLEMLTA